MKKYRCQVCGAEFVGEHDSCPICGVDKSMFVEIKEVEPANNEQYRLVIIGAGIGGLTVAEKVREYNKQAEIFLITKSKNFPYNRTVLTKKLLSIKVKKELLHDENFYREKNIKLMLDCRVKKIMPRTKEIRFQDDTCLKYDKLVIATGARAKSIYNGFQNVQTIRNYEDAIRIQEVAKTINDVLIIGGGVLALEAAASLVSAGKNVTILERFSRLMPRFLDEEASEILLNKIRELGINVYLNASISKCYGEPSIATVVLNDETIISTDYIIESIGVTPNIDLATSVGINIDKGIVINTNGQTSIEDIYACGDCACIEGRNFGLWGEAIEKGLLVANHLCGIEGKKITDKYPMVLHIPNFSLCSIGRMTNDFETKKVGDSFVKKYLCDSEVVGAILINSDNQIGDILAQIK